MLHLTDISVNRGHRMKSGMWEGVNIGPERRMEIDKGILTMPLQ